VLTSDQSLHNKG